MYVCFAVGGAVVSGPFKQALHLDKQYLPLRRHDISPHSSRSCSQAPNIFMGRRTGSSRSGSGGGGGRRVRTPRRGDGRRPNRVGEMIRREMASILDNAFATMPSSAGIEPVLVSVVDVRCSDDLRNARVAVSVLGDDTQKASAISWLKENRKQLRFELAQGMRSMKYIPELTFAESEVAQAVKTVNIIDRLAQERRVKEAQNAVSGARIGDVANVSESLSTDLEMDAMAEDPFVDLGDDDIEDGNIVHTLSLSNTVEASDATEEDDFIVDLDDDDEDDVNDDEDGDDDDDDDDFGDFEGVDDREVLAYLYKTMPDFKIEKKPST